MATQALQRGNQGRKKAERVELADLRGVKTKKGKKKKGTGRSLSKRAVLRRVPADLALQQLQRTLKVTGPRARNVSRMSKESWNSWRVPWCVLQDPPFDFHPESRFYKLCLHGSTVLSLCSPIHVHIIFPCDTALFVVPPSGIANIVARTN